LAKTVVKVLKYTRTASAKLKIFWKISTKNKKIQQFYSEACNIQILDIAYIMYCFLGHIVHVTVIRSASTT